MAFVAFLVALFVLSFIKLSKVSYQLIFTVTFFIIAASVIFFVPTMNERFVEILGSEVNSTNVRWTIYSCAIELVKDNWITGVSVEHLQPSLNACYKTAAEGIGFPRYNTHNEYLNLLCGKGVFGLLAFLTLIAMLVKKAARHPDYFSFCIIFCLVCVSENILERQIGVFFITVLGGLYGFHYPSSRQLEEANEFNNA